MAWIRPGDWVVMPTPAAQEIYVLAAVFNNASNYVALTITCVSGYTVDWGDGNVTTHASAVAAEHTYDYADTDLGALTTRGYKQALVKISPTTPPNTITVVQMATKHTRANLNGYSQPWLDFAANIPSCTSVLFVATLLCSRLERVVFTALGALTSTASMFNSCAMLQAVEWPVGSLAAVTTMDSMFSSCRSLQRISFPAGSLSLVTTAASTFLNCTALREVTLPAGAWPVAATVTSTFGACLALQEISFPAGAFAVASGNHSNMFVSSASLRKVTFGAGSLALVTNITSMFSGCAALDEIVLPSGAFASVSTTTSAFATCTSLAKISNCGIPVSFSIASCKIAGAQLDEIYTALPTISSQTITVSTNHGIVADTPTIATGKGWTVTGS